MNKLVFTVMVCGSMLAFGQDAAPSIPDAAKADKKVALQAKSLGLTVDEYKRLSPEEIKTKKAETRAKAEQARAKAKAEREAKKSAAKTVKGAESK